MHNPDYARKLLRTVLTSDLELQKDQRSEDTTINGKIGRFGRRVDGGEY